MPEAAILLAPRDVTERYRKITANQPPKIRLLVKLFIFHMFLNLAQISYFGASGGLKMHLEARSASLDEFGDLDFFQMLTIFEMWKRCDVM